MYHLIIERKKEKIRLSIFIGTFLNLPEKVLVADCMLCFNFDCLFCNTPGPI